MARRRTLTNKIARVENFFVENAQYVLNAREQKIVLHLAANLDTTSENFNEQIVSIKDLEAVLKQSDKKWGGIYKEVADFSERIVGKKIKFPTNVLLNGKALPGYITWFSSIAPCYNDADEVCLKFRFNPDLKPFLLRLNEYVRIDLTEIAGLNSFYSLRLYQIFKANLARRSKYVKTVKKNYSLEELRQLFGAKKKYDSFKYFNRDIITKAINEINEKTQIYVKHKGLRTGRKTTHVQFIFCEKKDHKDYTQLSFLDKNPMDSDKKTPDERKAKQETFNLATFKKSYPEVYKKQVRETRKKCRDLKLTDENQISTYIENACANWYAEFT
jgi:plasmid replication initiation protein